MILDTIKQRGGFVKDNEIDALHQEHPTTLVLTRLHGGRFVATPKDTEWFINVIERSRGDAVRDVSLNPHLPLTIHGLATGGHRLYATKDQIGHFALILTTAGCLVEILGEVQTPQFQKL